MHLKIFDCRGSTHGRCRRATHSTHPPTASRHHFLTAGDEPRVGECDESVSTGIFGFVLGHIGRLPGFSQSRPAHATRTLHDWSRLEDRGCRKPWLRDLWLDTLATHATRGPDAVLRYVGSLGDDFASHAEHPAGCLDNAHAARVERPSFPFGCHSLS